MFILAPIPDVNDLTNVENGQTVAILPIDILSVQSVKEDTETGYAIIEYKGGKVIKTLMPFVELLAIYTAQGAVYFDFADSCANISPNVKAFIKKQRQ